MFFGLGFWNKRVTFEVFLRVEDRWQLHVLCDDEDDALFEARHLLITAKTSAVRVVRLRTLANGVSSDTVIYEQELKVKGERPVTVSTPAGDVACCEKPEDLFTAEGRQTISQVMRDYLFRNNLSTSELIHSYSHLRKIQDVQGLVMAAVHRVATAQANAAKTAPKQRVQLLDNLIHQVQRRARDMAAERGAYPDFTGGDLEKLSKFILTKVPLDQHDYVLVSLLSIWLFDFRTIAAKVEALATLAADNVESGLVRQLDGVLADMLIFADIVQELFAPQPNLGTGLIAIAQVVLQRPGAAEKIANPIMKRIATLIQDGHLPQCQGALADRLLREINGDRPLDARAPENDAALLDRLIRTLTGEGGTLLGGERTALSIERRRLRQRELVLRSQGLHSIADSLRS